MVELTFRIRSSVFKRKASKSRYTRAITLVFPTLDEAGLLCEAGSSQIIPHPDAFVVSNSRNRPPVIEGFADSLLGEFVRAQIESSSARGVVPQTVEINGLERFLKESRNPGEVDLSKDIISVVLFKKGDVTAQSLARVVDDTGFVDDLIVIGVRSRPNFRRSRCLLTFEGREGEAAAILGHLRDWLAQEAENQAEGNQGDGGQQTDG